MTKSYKNDRVGIMWEILVPATFKSGKEIPVEFHKKWDDYVKSLAGGLTIHKPSIGLWSEGEYNFREKMIPVGIICSEGFMKVIAEYTKKYYDQVSVMYYKVSDYAVITYNGDFE